jgi:hypothetical protein
LPIGKVERYRRKVKQIKAVLEQGKKKVGPTGNEQTSNLTDPESEGHLLAPLLEAARPEPQPRGAANFSFDSALTGGTMPLCPSTWSPVARFMLGLSWVQLRLRTPHW